MRPGRFAVVLMSACQSRIHLVAENDSRIACYFALMAGRCRIYLVVRLLEATTVGVSSLYICRMVNSDVRYNRKKYTRRHSGCVTETYRHNRYIHTYIHVWYTVYSTQVNKEILNIRQ